MTTEHPYEMSISLNVLNHLGIGLYSNVPAVLSEIVANSWDADAKKVTIDINSTSGEIIITDDGVGMTLSDINNKFLKVGYRKREEEENAGVTSSGRSPMGRKGIGKLSVFSIADVVEVYSVKGNEKNALQMSLKAIQEQIADSEKNQNNASRFYFPTPLGKEAVDISVGTKIVLKDFRKSLGTTVTFLRKRLARRFSVIGPANNFQVVVNGEEITPKDRDYYDRIEFLWYFGDESADYVYKCKNLQQSFKISDVISDNLGYKIRGWIGTVDEARNDEDQNNTIVIFANGKLIQEDLLGDFKEGGIYTKYLIGDIDADFMDVNTKADIVTSNRQNVKEDDDRYDLLKLRIGAVLKLIQNQWTPLRREVGSKRALQQPMIKVWYDQLQGDNRRSARDLFGKIESLKVSDSTTKKEMYKLGVLAFERLALKNSLSLLDNLEPEEDFTEVLQLFSDIDDLEAAHYYEITKGRIEVIRKFEGLVPASKESVIQKYIFDHLWLLDPSWERSTGGSERIEQSVTKEFDKVSAHLTDEERKGRIDIRYRTAAKKHIIIELKKYDRPVTAFELAEQVQKYYSALETCLRVQFHEDHPQIESICIVGSQPDPKNNLTVVEKTLAAVNARFITYDTLISQTLETYKDYLERDKKVSKIMALIERIENEMP